MILVTVTTGIALKLHTRASTAVPGQSYMICDNPGQFLTSPWTYHSLTSGSQSYTVAQYEALSGYGTTLPPLPSYISGQDPSTEAAVIFAPGSTVSQPAYLYPQSPIIYFFEGGAYPELDMQTVSGDQFIGGSAPGFPEPQFNDGGAAGGIGSGNDHFGYNGGATTMSATAGAGATSVSTTSAVPNYTNYITFADGSTHQISSFSGSTITLSSPLTTTEAQGGAAWTSSSPPLAEVTTPAAQGSTSLVLTASSVPLVRYDDLVIGGDPTRLTSVLGNQSGYTVGVAGLDMAVAANTPLFYYTDSGDVSIEYLDISNDLHSTTGTFTVGQGWTIMHNKIHDSIRNAAEGVALYGGDESTIEYNCMSKMGSSGGGGGGTGEVFDYNELYQTGAAGDPGCGCTGNKWWGTLNADIVDNAFVENGIGGGTSAIWLDNGNTGTNISGNYFYHNYGQAVESETGFNLNITGNLFQDNNWGAGSGCGDSNCTGAVALNSSGGFNVPLSRYNNQVNIAGNQFQNNWGGITVWQSGLRNCAASGEGYPIDATYCTGGFPTTDSPAAGGQYYFSHEQNDTPFGYSTDPITLVAGASSGSTTILVHGAEAINDQIGFTSTSSTTTSNTSDVAGFAGSGTVSVGSTSGFPPTGQLYVTTSSGIAILSYTGTTATSFTGVSLINDPEFSSSGTLSGSIKVSYPLRTSTTSTPDVSSLTGAGTISVPSTAGFPSSGQLRASTSATGYGGGLTGAILSYTGATSTSFTGVALVRGSGSLDGHIQQVEPYKVTSETCYSNDCAITVSPALTASASASTTVTNAGTCALFATGAATASSPIAPSGDSYLDGCQWGTKHISVTGNSFVFDPAYIAASTTATGHAGTTCTVAHADYCGTNFMAYQDGGASPYGTNIEGNALMSNSSFTGCPSWDSGCTSDPLNNINSLSNAPYAPPDNGEQPANNLWSNNTYQGPWIWNTYNYGACGNVINDPNTGKSAPADACQVNFANWQGYWQQDAGSTYSATVSPTPIQSITPTPSASPSGKVGDLNNDNQVNIFDLSILLSDWGTANTTADINHDGTVNIFDLSILLSHWGT
jgi:hypothetical protein